MLSIASILIGLVMVLIAISLAGYRHVYEPRTRVTRGTDAVTASRSIDRARPDAAVRSAPSSQRQQPSASPSTTGTSMSTWATFDAVVNVLNVIVGVVGIVLALMGMRMQRQAMAMQSGRADGRR